eukprot:scaffold5682_cov140-Cylindrotheca_fusiformis.AAC.3
MKNLGCTTLSRAAHTMAESLLNTEEVEVLEFDDDMWTEYESAAAEVFESKRALKKEKLENLKEARNALLSRDRLRSIPSPRRDGEATKEYLAGQKARYMEHYKLTSAQFSYVTRCLVYLGDFCAKQKRAAGIRVAWEKMKESGMLPRENAISTYMYILGIDDVYSDALVEVATFHDSLFPPNEKTITLRIKSLIGRDEVEEAEKLLSSLSDEKDGVGFKKLRTFLPILEHYCTSGDANSILRIFRQMRNSPCVIFDADSYALIIGSLAELGCFCVGAKAIDEAATAGFTATHGPTLFDEIASEMADDILELTEPAARRLLSSFTRGFSLENLVIDCEIPEMQSDDESSDSPVKLGRVEIDTTTALCPGTGTKLRLIALDEYQRQHVHDTLIKMAGIQFVEFTKGRKKPMEENMGVEELTLFSNWLDTREGKAFTVVVDGPNVGFHGSGSFHYSQLMHVVRELERMGETPLVTMPSKYIGPTFKLRCGQRQYLSDKDLAFIDSLMEKERIYVVPSLCLDDYYWMLASVSNQTMSRQMSGLEVEACDQAGRFPGLRPMLVTNDQMRDHKLDLLTAREFRRWSSCHIVNYEVPKVEQGEWEDRHVKFFPADFFSREIQGNTNGIVDGTVWHFPVTEWGESSRFCIAIAPQ